MIYVKNATIQTVVQSVTDATDPGKDALYTPAVGKAKAKSAPSPSSAPAADKDCA